MLSQYGYASRRACISFSSRVVGVEERRWEVIVRSASCQSAPCLESQKQAGAFTTSLAKLSLGAGCSMAAVVNVSVWEELGGRRMRGASSGVWCAAGGFRR